MEVASVAEVAMDRLVEIPATVNQVVAEEAGMEDRLAVHRDTANLQVISWRLFKPYNGNKPRIQTYVC